MRHLLSIFLCGIGFTVYAADCCTPFVSPLPPSVTIQSVNHSDYMISGSTYRSEVYDVGAATPYSPAIRTGGPGGTDNTGYDPNNPQFAPIGDGVCLLTVMALLFALVIFVRSKKLHKECL